MLQVGEQGSGSEEVLEMAGDGENRLPSACGTLGVSEKLISWSEAKGSACLAK
jgi:hypothetical protein